MEKIRKNIFAKIKLRRVYLALDRIKLFKNGSSIALMIDQRVSEGLYTEFLEKAYTTTIPAQFVKNLNVKLFQLY